MLKFYHGLSFNILVLLALLTSSCVSIQRYPSEWPPLISMENEKCLNISGTYMNVGEKTDKTIVCLSHGFIGRDVAVTHVQITQSDDDKLEIIFWNDDNLVSKKIYSRSKNEFSCTSEGITIPLGSHVTTDFGEGFMPVSASWDTFYLNKNSNGELVIRVTSSGMGLYFIIPVAGSAADYVRFKEKQ